MDHPQLVGILNLTPDSFSGDGQTDVAEALAQADRMFNLGVTLVDIGAESTRPGAIPLSPDEEWARLEPVFSELINKYPGKISLDTYHPETLIKALAISHEFIANDVTGLNNEKYRQIIIENNLPVMISHFPASLGQDIQAGHQPENKIDSLGQVKQELLARRQELIDGGLPADKIILDPGIGFGKTIELNQKLVSFAKELPGIDVLIGYSKKSFMGDDRLKLEANLNAGKIAAAAGAKYLRLHEDLLAVHLTF